MNKNIEAMKISFLIFSIAIAIMVVIGLLVVGSIKALGPWGPAYTMPPLMFLAAFLLVRFG